MSQLGGQTKKIFLLAVWVSVLLLPVGSQAQVAEESWGNLSGLLVGQKIQVVDRQLRSQDGIFIRVDADAITFRVGQQESTVEREIVLRVSSREHLGRGTKALIGLGVGAAAGAATMAIMMGHDRGYFDGYGAALVVTGGVVVGGIGAGVGAAVPSGHPTIYRAERRQSNTAP